MKKGDVVWFFQNWDSKATVAVTKLTLQSFGAKKATAVGYEDGKFIRRFIYAHQYGDLVLVSECPDPIAEGLRRAAVQRQAKIESYRNIQCWFADSDDESSESKRDARYHAQMKKECEAVINAEPIVTFL